MKQAEKSKLTYDKILNAAIKEFGTKSYDNASINNICNDNNISKGLIYHNFKNKNQLYLRCVELCYNEITAFLSNIKYENLGFDESLQLLLHSRYQFFRENPYYSNIFFNTILQPPKHLIDQINALKSEFDDFNSRQYKKIISSITLRDTITPDEALEYFFAFQELLNGYYQTKAFGHADLGSLIEDHELKLSKILNIMLYGIAKEK